MIPNALEYVMEQAIPGYRAARVYAARFEHGWNAGMECKRAAKYCSSNSESEKAFLAALKHRLAEHEKEAKWLREAVHINEAQAE